MESDNQLAILYMEQLQSLMNDISEWSDSTFGDAQRNPGIVYHLKMEADELIEALDKSALLGADLSVGIGEYGRQVKKTKMEFADCFMLLLDSASHFHLSAEELIETTRKKLEINKKRKWGKPDKNGVVEHIRE
jgi:NTP pyrophosphatase (non-canonical NTP hydrolase)